MRLAARSSFRMKLELEIPLNRLHASSKSLSCVARRMPCDSRLTKYSFQIRFDSFKAIVASSIKQSVDPRIGNSPALNSYLSWRDEAPLISGYDVYG